MDPKSRRGGTSHFTDANGTSGGSSTQQTLPPKETGFVINNVGDIKVRVHEHDIFHAENPVTNIQNFTINRDILIAALFVFKAMLTNTFFSNLASLPWICMKIPASPAKPWLLC